MNPLDWIEIDECYEEELALRKELIKNNRSIVIHSLPGVSHLLMGLAVRAPNLPNCGHAAISALKHESTGWLDVQRVNSINAARCPSIQCMMIAG